VVQPQGRPLVAGVGLQGSPRGTNGTARVRSQPASLTMTMPGAHAPKDDEWAVAGLLNTSRACAYLCLLVHSSHPSVLVRLGICPGVVQMSTRAEVHDGSDNRVPRRRRKPARGVADT
jgi:hypothetical protein